MARKTVLFVLAAGAIVALLYYSQWRKEVFHVSGFIEADEVRLGSRVAGRVAKVAVEEGQEARKGDIIVELEPFDLIESRARAQAELAAARADDAKYSAGYRAEEIAQAKARHGQIAARLEKL